MFPRGRPEMMDILFDSLENLGIPYIFSCMSGTRDGFQGDKARYTEADLERMNRRPNVCWVRETPQWAVLRHPATGLFVVSRLSRRCLL